MICYAPSRKFIRERGVELESIEDFASKVEAGKRDEPDGIEQMFVKSPPSGYGAPYYPYYMFFGYSVAEENSDGDPLLYYVEVHKIEAEEFAEKKVRELENSYKT